MARTAFQAASCCAAALLVVAGCTGTSDPRGASSPGPGSSSGRDSISELHLFGNPLALNLDGLPGPDGIGVRVYASTSSKAQGVVIRDGRLDILMFDGGGGAGEPRKIWSFEPASLKSYATKGSLGIGYEFALPWGTNRPVESRVTVIARLRLSKERVITSDSSSISVSVR